MLEYREVGHFVEGLIEKREQERISDKLNIAEAVAMAIQGTRDKNGNQVYQKWFRDNSDKLKPKEKKPKKKFTIFDRMKKEKEASEKRKTIFDMRRG